MKRIGLIIVLAASGLALLIWCSRLTVRESGHGFVAGDSIVLGEYGYTHDGDFLRYAVFRTWPKNSTEAERSMDNRTALDSFGWRVVRDNDGRMIPVGTDGDVYFFEGDHLKTMKVRMNEHTDTMPLDDLKTVDAVWRYLQQFRIDRPPRNGR
jgi:hypothetical protein